MAPIRIVGLVLLSWLVNVADVRLLRLQSHIFVLIDSSVRVKQRWSGALSRLCHKIPIRTNFDCEMREKLEWEQLLVMDTE
jgi:hypothetical protein